MKMKEHLTLALARKHREAQHAPHLRRIWDAGLAVHINQEGAAIAGHQPRAGDLEGKLADQAARDSLTVALAATHGGMQQDSDWRRIWAAALAVHRNQGGKTFAAEKAYLGDLIAAFAKRVKQRMRERGERVPEDRNVFTRN